MSSNFGSQQRMFTQQRTAAGGIEGSRPMTSMAGAGYRSNNTILGTGRNFDPLKQKQQSFRNHQKNLKKKTLDQRNEHSLEIKTKKLEREITLLVEESTIALYRGEQQQQQQKEQYDTNNQNLLQIGLEKAKEAGKKERALAKLYDNNNNTKSNNKNKNTNDLKSNSKPELLFSVWFHLGNAYAENKMYDEAIHTYTFLLKKMKKYTDPSLLTSVVGLRLSLGNIYYRRKQYSLSLKMYRMALDNLPQQEESATMKHQIRRNIGNAQFKLGNFRDAIKTFELVMMSSASDSNDSFIPGLFNTGFSLILCYYTLDDTEKMKNVFSKILSIPIAMEHWKDEDEEEESKVNDDDPQNTQQLNDSHHQDRVDDEELQQKKRDEAEKIILSAARLIAPVLDKITWSNGYEWICEQLSIKKYPNIASYMKIEQALQHLSKHQEMDKAITILKSFERKDPHLKAIAATNLSFCYLVLEKNLSYAKQNADLAIQNTRYNSKALVNKGNCHFYAQEYDVAKEMYLESIGVQPTCIEALYNLGLVYSNLAREIDHDKEEKEDDLSYSSYSHAALCAFEKAHTLSPQNPLILYQIANNHEEQENFKLALKWFDKLHAVVPTDPGILSRIGNLFSKISLSEESESFQESQEEEFHYRLLSYNHHSTDLDNVIVWLGIWYMKQEMYEKSVEYFQRASQIQPNEIKWQLIISSCYRRMGDYSKAFENYQRLHQLFPENVSCKYSMCVCVCVCVYTYFTSSVCLF